MGSPFPGSQCTLRLKVPSALESLFGSQHGERVFLQTQETPQGSLCPCFSEISLSHEVISTSFVALNQPLCYHSRHSSPDFLSFLFLLKSLTKGRQKCSLTKRVFFPQLVDTDHVLKTDVLFSVSNIQEYETNKKPLFLTLSTKRHFQLCKTCFSSICMLWLNITRYL